MNDKVEEWKENKRKKIDKEAKFDTLKIKIKKKVKRKIWKHNLFFLNELT